MLSRYQLSDETECRPVRRILVETRMATGEVLDSSIQTELKQMQITQITEQ